MAKCFYIVILWFCFAFNGFSQEPCDSLTDDKSFQKQFKKAKDRKYPYKERVIHLKKLLEKYPENVLISWEMVRITYLKARMSGDYSVPMKYCLNIVENCPDFHSDLYYKLGNMYLNKGDYCEAKSHYEQFLKFESDDDGKFSRRYDKQIISVEKTMKQIEFYCTFYTNKLAFNPVKEPFVSTPNQDEYLPSISPDNSYLYYTKEYVYKSRGSLKSKKIQQLYRSEKQNNVYQKGEALGSPFNLNKQWKYGGVSLSANNRLMILCACQLEKNGYYNCDLFETKYVPNQDGVYRWSPLKSLGSGINGKNTWEAQPSLSSDGNVLIFASARPNCIGKTDLYMSRRDNLGNWKPAQNLGKVINTPFDEKSPFLHIDNKTLYFVSSTSEKRMGAGGLDIFFSRWNDKTKQWAKPVNLGYPINTGNDEYGIVVSLDGEKAFFSAYNKGTKDVFSFKLPKQDAPDKVKILRGKIKRENIKKMDSLELNILFEDGSKQMQNVALEKDGTFISVMNVQDKKGDVAIRAKSPAFNVAVLKSDQNVGDASFDGGKIKSKKTYEIQHLLYETNKATIKKSSHLILKLFAGWLLENSKKNIQIIGHTDNIGDKNHNKILSIKRANNVRDFLIKQGIDHKRIKAIGLGDTKPKHPNNSTENRAKNRRTEFKILN